MRVWGCNLQEKKQWKRLSDFAHRSEPRTLRKKKENKRNKMKRTSKIYYSSYREEKEKEAYEYHVRNAPGVKRLEALLLDSSLISQTKKREYDTKVVVCGDYIQLYKFRKKTLQDKGLEEMKDKKKKKKFDDLDLYKEENYPRRSEVGVVEYKNLLRSRIQLERLIKANEDTWNTFITLTFFITKSDNSSPLAVCIISFKFIIYLYLVNINTFL